MTSLSEDTAVQGAPFYPHMRLCMLSYFDKMLSVGSVEHPQPIAGRSDTWWKYFWVGKIVRLIWACCSLLWTVIIPWTKLRRMMCARGLRSSALLCGKSASKNTVFLPLMSVCFRAHSDPLSLSQTARKETLSYLQTSLSVSSVSQQDAASIWIKLDKGAYFVWIWKLFVVPVCS